jgi:hypothetical protein
MHLDAHNCSFGREGFMHPEVSWSAAIEAPISGGARVIVLRDGAS